MINNYNMVNVKEFINNFVEGVEYYLLETNGTTLYVDVELSDFLDIEVDGISDNLLDNTINQIIQILNNKNYNAYKYSLNEITVKNK